MDPAVFEKVFKNNTDIIQEFSWITPDIKNHPPAKISGDKVSDKARINGMGVGIYGVQPNIFKTTVQDFLKLNWRSSSALSVDE